MRLIGLVAKRFNKQAEQDTGSLCAGAQRLPGQGQDKEPCRHGPAGLLGSITLQQLSQRLGTKPSE